MVASDSARFRRIAAGAKFKALHEVAVLGNEPADAALLKFARQCKDDQDESIAGQS